jgi:uncharacterized protein YjbJ (UPF0337 family)
VTNTNKLKNATQHLTGRLKEATGRITGDKALRVEGKDDQTAANLKQAGEKVRDAFKK